MTSELKSKGYTGPRPVADRDSAVFWDGLREHRILVQRCAACGRYRWPLRAWCNRCQSWDFEVVAITGRGRIRSWIVVHRAHIVPYAQEIPYKVVLIEIEEQDDIVIPGNLADFAEPITAGMEVEACFVDIDDTLTLLRWRPV